MENAIICQSCGVPMTKSEDFGTNQDGSKNDEYCTYCFQNGVFTWPDATMEDMIGNLVEMSSQWGVTKEEAEKTARETLPMLKRWRS